MCNLPVKRFLSLGLRIYPDEKTIHKYRSELSKSGRCDEVFAQFDEKLFAKGNQMKLQNEWINLPSFGTF